DQRNGFAERHPDLEFGFFTRHPFASGRNQVDAIVVLTAEPEFVIPRHPGRDVGARFSTLVVGGHRHQFVRTRPIKTGNAPKRTVGASDAFAHLRGRAALGMSVITIEATHHSFAYGVHLALD